MARARICLEIAKLSNCERGKVGAVIINPKSFTILADGYNGGPRGMCGDFCGGDTCTRTDLGIASGDNVQIGCHHAEMNALGNAGRNGVTTLDMAMITSCEPCVMCAKLIHHAGISSVYVISDTYPCKEGVEYLGRVGIWVKPIAIDQLVEGG